MNFKFSKISENNQNTNLINSVSLNQFITEVFDNANIKEFSDIITHLDSEDMTQPVFEVPDSFIKQSFFYFVQSYVNHLENKNEDNISLYERYVGEENRNKIKSVIETFNSDDFDADELSDMDDVDLVIGCFDMDHLYCIYETNIADSSDIEIEVSEMLKTLVAISVVGQFIEETREVFENENEDRVMFYGDMSEEETGYVLKHIEEVVSRYNNDDELDSVLFHVIKKDNAFEIYTSTILCGFVNYISECLEPMVSFSNIIAGNCKVKDFHTINHSIDDLELRWYIMQFKYTLTK